MLQNTGQYIERLFHSYKLWVQKNPQTIGDLETTSKWVSYFIAGKISESDVVTELIYMLSNILVLCNDRIIAETGNDCLQSPKGDAVHKIKLLLTTLEYSEVFIEFSARKSFGQRGKWIIIAIVQIIKTIGRLFLMKRSANSIVQVPPIPAIDRKRINQDKSFRVSSNFQNSHVSSENINFTFKLKRSGKLARKVEGAPPMHLRSCIPSVMSDVIDDDETILNKRTLQTAETIYITKPLIHLSAIGLFGHNSWKSYAMALVMDLISIRMFHKNRHLLTQQQKVELSKRCVNLLLYLARSPFFEWQTKKPIENILNGLGNKILFTKTIMTHIIGFIPYYQESYFYMWSN